MEAATAASARTLLIRHGSPIADVIAIACLLTVAVAARLVTAGLFASGISTDEYRYSIIAQEWLRITAGQSSMTLQELVVHHPLVPVTTAIASFISGADPLAAGRTVQLAFNAGTAPLLYLLMRAAGSRIAAALTGAAGLVLMPGFWEASATFLPDSQLVFFSTLTFLGVMLGLGGRSWGHGLAAVALGCGFLTKEHLPLVLLPSIGVLWAVWLMTGKLHIREICVSVMALAAGVVVAALAGWLGIGVPRAIVLTAVGRIDSSPAVDDGLPPPAPVLESAAGTSWISSLVSAVITRDFGLEWFPDAFGIHILSGAVVVMGLVGACILIAAYTPSGELLGRPPRWVAFACVAIAIGMFAAQIVVRGAADALLVAAALLTAFLLVSSGRISSRPIENDWPRTDASPNDRAAFWSLVAGQSAYVLFTIAFFALKLEQVSFLPRMFLPIMPACALFFGIGCVGVARALRPFTERLSAAALVIVGGVIIGLALPGGPIRKAGAIVTACALGVILQWSGLGKRLPHTQTMAVLIAILALLVGTPAMTTLARGREFRGFPDDRYYTSVTGGIRVTTFRAAESWLRSNIRPDEIVITSKPYQVSWHAALGFAGFQATRVWDERAVDRRRYLSDASLQRASYDWIIDFNQFAVQGDSPEGPAFEEDYRWLQSRPYLREAYATSDDQGRVLLYAFRHVRGRTRGV